MLRSIVVGVSLLVVAACNGGAPPTATPSVAPTTPPTPGPTATPAPSQTAPATSLVTPGTGVLPGGDDWSASAAPLQASVGERYLFTCPPNGTESSIWGTDIYTNDSSVCNAAVHSGLITYAAGGAVTIEIRPGEEQYVGSTRNGVTSSSYPSWSQSFVFVGGPVAGATPTAGTTPDMPPGDPLVLAHIPPAFNVNCNAVTTFSAGEVAAVQCTPPQVTGYITYVLFEDEDGPLDAWFSDFDYFAPGVEGGDCATGPCLVAWIGTNGFVEGRYFANNYTGIDPNGLIASWFDAYERVQASLVVHDTTFAELYDLALQAGPIH